MFLSSTDYVANGGWRRTRKQIGHDLSDSERINAGIGPRLAIMETYDLDPSATVTFCDQMDISIAGELTNINVQINNFIELKNNNFKFYKSDIIY